MNQRNLKRPAVSSLTEYDVIRKHFRFLRESDEPARSREDAYGQEMAKKYENKLYKQSCVVDLSRYREGKVGCRWRTAREVKSMKGEAVCGESSCNQAVISSYEMNFGYVQAGEKCNALVKVSVCGQCGKKLNFKKEHKELRRSEGQ